MGSGEESEAHKDLERRCDANTQARADGESNLWHPVRLLRTAIGTNRAAAFPIDFSPFFRRFNFQMLACWVAYLYPCRTVPAGVTPMKRAIPW